MSESEKLHRVRIIWKAYRREPMLWLIRISVFAIAIVVLNKVDDWVQLAWDMVPNVRRAIGTILVFIVVVSAVKAYWTASRRSKLMKTARIAITLLIVFGIGIASDPTNAVFHWLARSSPPIVIALYVSGFLIFAGFFCAVYWIGSEKPAIHKTRRMCYVFFALSVSVIGSNLYQAWRSQGVLPHQAVLTFGPWMRMNVIMLLLSVGGLLYVFKRAAKAWYGLSEVTIAIVTNWALVKKLTPFTVDFRSLAVQDGILLGTTVYLFSRGVGNIIEGLEEIEKKAKSD
jgi:hypothetical protein